MTTTTNNDNGNKDNAGEEEDNNKDRHNDRWPAPTTSIVTASTMQSTINLCVGKGHERKRVRTGKNK